MEKVLDGLRSKPDIIGAYVFHVNSGVTAKNIPDDFTDIRLTAIAEKGVKIFSSEIKMLPDVSEVSLVYEETTVTICSITDRNYLILLSAPDVRSSLLHMVLQPAVDELKYLIANASGKNAPKPEKLKMRVTEPADENTSLIDSEQLMAAGSMAKLLKELQVTLVKVVGPIAKIIFLDSVKEWMATDHPDLSTIPNLLGILSREINDPEKFNIYRKKIMSRVW